MIAAGIVLYNPDIRRLIENISAIKNQVGYVILVNNSPEISIRIKNIAEKELTTVNYKIINNEYNMGIAKALNQIMHCALLEGYEWVITLDQDTVCPVDLLEKMLPFIKIKDVGIICPKVVDRNFCFDNNEHGSFEFVDKCITSASLTSLEIWKKVGGYDERLFIDYVDFDYCLNLKQHGYKILRVNNIDILHEIGHAREFSVLNKKILVFNHPAMRIYYIARNKLFCAHKYKETISKNLEIKELLTMIFRVVIFETDKCNKVVAFIRGIIDGRKMIRKFL